MELPLWEGIPMADMSRICFVFIQDVRKVYEKRPQVGRHKKRCGIISP